MRALRIDKVPNDELYLVRGETFAWANTAVFIPRFSSTGMHS